MINCKNLFSCEYFDKKEEEKQIADQSQEDLLFGISMGIMVIYLLATIITCIVFCVSESKYMKKYNELIRKMSKEQKEELDSLIKDVTEFTKTFAGQTGKILSKIFKEDFVFATYNYLNPDDIKIKSIEAKNSDEYRYVQETMKKNAEDFVQCILKCLLMKKPSAQNNCRTVFCVTCRSGDYWSTENIANKIDALWNEIFKATKGWTTFQIHGKTLKCHYQTKIFDDDNHLYSDLTFISAE